MVINCRKWRTTNDREKYARRVFVDGQEIRLVWYVDRRRGRVKTYDLGEGKAHSPIGFKRENYPKDWFIDAPMDGAVSRVLRGKVTLCPLAN